VTVSELIELLQQCPAGLRVVVNGYEEGYDDLTPEQISMTKISLDTGEQPWEGRHGDPRDRKEGSAGSSEVVDALVLRRASN